MQPVLTSYILTLVQQHACCRQCEQMPYLVLVGRISQLVDGLRAETLQRFLECRWKDALICGQLVLIQPEYAQCGRLVVLADIQEPANKAVYCWPIFCDVMGVVVCRAKEPEHSILDALYLQISMPG